MKKNGKNHSEKEKQRSRLSQEDVPAFSLAESLRLARALYENFGKDAAPPLRLAGALNMAPNGTQFRMLAGSALAYGLTTGGYNVSEINLAPLGQRIVRCTEEGDDINAQREALLRPRIIGEFLKKYDNSPLPKPEVAKHILEDLGVPRDRATDVFEIISSSAKELGFLQQIKDKLYVDLRGVAVVANRDNEENRETQPDEFREPTAPTSLPPIVMPPTAPAMTNRKVFITHGKNRAFVEPIKKFLEFGEMQPFVSVEKQTISEPVPDKVLNEMRACTAAIIHVEDELKLVDNEGREHIMLNPNVLIEIGAAMALYGRRFILLVKDGVRLPSNLQGLFEVRYKGESLDGEATVKLLGSIAELKKLPPPSSPILETPKLN